jgi:hypothetical protein hcinC1_00210
MLELSLFFIGGSNMLNRTEHSVKIFNTIGVETPDMVLEQYTGEPIRVSYESRKVGVIEGIDIYKNVYGEVTGLPEFKKGVYYVVSAMVRQALPGRKDLLSPGQLIRNEAGQPIGCLGLVRNS